MPFCPEFHECSPLIEMHDVIALPPDSVLVASLVVLGAVDVAVAVVTVVVVVVVVVVDVVAPGGPQLTFFNSADII